METTTTTASQVQDACGALIRERLSFTVRREGRNPVRWVIATDTGAEISASSLKRLADKGFTVAHGTLYKEVRI